VAIAEKSVSQELAVAVKLLVENPLLVTGREIVLNPDHEREPKLRDRHFRDDQVSARTFRLVGWALRICLHRLDVQ
jgi:hypothetical protein